MATTRSERRRRWFLRTQATAGWLTSWRTTVQAASIAALTDRHGPSQHARLWTKFAADARVPTGVMLHVRQRGTGVTITVPLSDPYLLIGNHPRCQLQLDGLAEEETHFALFWLHGELYGVDLRINHPRYAEEPRGDGWWSDGQSLRLGDYQLQVRGLPGIPARTVPVDDHSTVMLQLATADKRQEQRLTRWLTLVGCAAQSGVILREPGIAARQTALIRTPTSLWIVNLANGLPPRLGDRPVEWAALDPLDEFSFGAIKGQAMITWPDLRVDALTSAEPDLADPVETNRTRMTELHAELMRLLNPEEALESVTPANL